MIRWTLTVFVRPLRGTRGWWTVETTSKRRRGKVSPACCKWWAELSVLPFLFCKQHNSEIKLGLKALILCWCCNCRWIFQQHSMLSGNASWQSSSWLSAVLVIAGSDSATKLWALSQMSLWLNQTFSLLVIISPSCLKWITFSATVKKIDLVDANYYKKTVV